MGVQPAEVWAWPAEQVDWLLASAEVESEFGAHGEVLADAINEKANPNDYEGGYRYVAEGPKINWAEKAIGDAQEAFFKDNPNNSRAGLLWTVKRVNYPPTD